MTANNFSEPAEVETYPGPYTTTYVQTNIQGYPVGTETVTYTSKASTVTYAAVPAATTTFVTTETYTFAPESSSILLPTAPAAPGCRLPSSYSVCQSEWEVWASKEVIPFPPLPTQTNCLPYIANPPPGETGELTGNIFTWFSTPQCYYSWGNVTSSWSDMDSVSAPSCHQATITGPLCTSLKNAYVSGQNKYLWPSGWAGGWMTKDFSEGWYDGGMPGATGYTWPTSHAFAPGCTLGCGQCAVTGGAVRLLYFPPGLTPTTSGPVVVSTNGTAFTSPTYYISFASVNASDACSALPGTVTSTIVPVPTDYQLSSIWGIPGQCFAYGADQRTWALTDTASFNITDILTTPVPSSIVTSQPWCATLMACEGPAVCESLPYKPQLVVPNVVLQDLNPAWVSCSADLRGFFDPPIALTTTNIEPGVTTPGSPITTTASPASGPTPGASKTGDPSIQQPAQTTGHMSSSHFAASQGSPGVTTPDPANTPSEDTSAITPQSQVAVSVSLVETKTTNALSILLSAEASLDASVGTQASSFSDLSSNDPSATGYSGPADPTTMSQPLTFGPGSTTFTAGSIVVTMQDPGTRSDDVVIGTATLRQGETTKFNGMPVSVGSTAVVVGNPSASAPEQSSYVTLVEGIFTGTDGAPITMARIGSSMVIKDAETTMTLVMGSQTTVDGQEISLATISDAVVFDGTTTTLSTTHLYMGDAPDPTTSGSSSSSSSSSSSANPASVTPAPVTDSSNRLAVPTVFSVASCVLLGLLVA